MIRLVSLLFLLIFLLNTPVFTEEPSRYVVETAFVYKFIKFVNWPEDQNKSVENINLCYLGSGKISSPLLELNGYQVKDKRIAIQTYKTMEKIKTCHIVFIDIPSKAVRNSYVNRLKSDSILTISHFDGFIDDGGMINFLIVDNKVNFEINYISIKNSNLKVSSKLLKLAKRIISENNLSKSE